MIAEFGDRPDAGGVDWAKFQETYASSPAAARWRYWEESAEYFNEREQGLGFDIALALGAGVGRLFDAHYSGDPALTIDFVPFIHGLAALAHGCNCCASAVMAPAVAGLSRRHAESSELWWGHLDELAERYEGVREAISIFRAVENVAEQEAARMTLIITAAPFFTAVLCCAWASKVRLFDVVGIAFQDHGGASQGDDDDDDDE